MSSTIRASLALALLLLAFLIAVGFRAESLPYAPDADYSDSTISRYPDALYFRRSVVEDRILPLWNPHLMGGQPFAANPGTKTWYPLTWALIFWSPEIHISLMTAFHLWLGGIGMWFWAQRTGLRTSPALLASFAYMLAPKLIAHAGAGHLDLLIAVSWLPWMLFAIHLLFEHSGFIAAAALGFTIAMIFIGAIQLVPFLYGLGFLYVLMLLRNSERWRSDIKLLMLAVVLALGFSAIQWLPLIELREAVSRGTILEENAAIFSMKPGQWIGLLIGDHGGNAEYMTYVGVSIFILAGVGLVLQPNRNHLWWGVILFAALYSLGINFILWSGLVKVFPPLLYFRVPGRAWFLIAFLLPYLAGWGIQTLLDKPPDTPRARLIVVGLVAFGLTCSLSSLVILNDTEIEITALTGLFALPLTTLLIALVVFRKIPTQWALSLVMVLVIFDLLWIDRTLIEGRERSEWLNETPPAVLQDITGRIYTPSYSIPQQDTAYWRIPRFDGVDPFQIGAFVGMTEFITGIPLEGYSTTVPAIVVLEDLIEVEDPVKVEQYKNAPMDARLLAQWQVEIVVTNYPIEIEGLELVAQDDKRYFYRNTFFGKEDVILAWDGPNKVRQILNTDEPVSTIANAPGWTWESGDAVDNSLVSLPAETGTFIYRPKGVFIGMGITLTTYLLTLIGLWWQSRKAQDAASH